MTLKSYAKFEEKLTGGLGNDMRNLTIFTRILESVKIGNLMGSFLPKVENACAKIYRGVMTNDTEEWWKNWRGIILLFQNWGIWRIWPKHLKVSKIWTLMAGFFWKKVYNVWTKKALRSYLSWNWKMMRNLMRNWLVVSRLKRGIWRIFIRALERLSFLLW